MPLVEQRLSFPVTAGQQQGMAEELVDPPELVKAWNVSYDRAGELSKRRGWHGISETVRDITRLPQCDRLTQRGDELLWIGEQVSNSLEDRTDNQLLSRVVGESYEDSSPTTWERNGRIPKLVASKLLSTPVEITDPSQMIAAWDIAYAGDADSPEVATEGVLCVVWQHTGTTAIHFLIVDVATKAVLRKGYFSPGTSTDCIIRVVACKGSDSKWYFHLFAPTGTLSGGTTIEWFSIEAYNPSIWTDRGGFQSGVVAFDVCTTNPVVTGPIGAGDFERRLFFVYTLAAAANVVRVDLYRMSTSGSMSSSTGATTSGATGAANQVFCTCDPNGRHVGVVAGINSPNEMLYQFDAATGPSGAMSFHNYYLLTSFGISAVGAAIGWVGTAVVSSNTRFDNWFMSWCASSRYYGARSEFAIANGATSKAFGGIRDQYFATPYSRVFSWQGCPYQVVMKGNQIDSTGLEVLSWADAAGVNPWTNKEARFAVGEISETGSTARLVAYSRCRNSVVESWIDRGNWYYAAPTIAIDGTQMMSVYKFSATDANRYETAQLPGLAMFSGGIPWEYDGDTAHESGFYPRPYSIGAGPIVGGAVSASAPTIAPDDYWICACWESIDSNGRVSRSAPSDKVLVSVASTGFNLTVTFAPYGETWHQRLRLVVYVSNDDGLTFVRSKQQILDNITSAGDITVTLDPTLLFQTDSPTLYSDSIMANASLQSADHICEWQGRIWLASGSIVWPSREVISGESPGFNESMQFELVAPCSGLASLDDRLVIFCTDRVYWLSGDGPTDTGAGGSFSPPQRLPTDFGCVNARSIVRCEKGILFQSSRGIELLGRGMDTRQVSGGVDRLIRDQGYSRCVASSYDPEEQIARFIMAGPDGARLVLQWHHGFELWTVAQVSAIGSNGHACRPSGIARAFSRNWMSFDDDLSQLSYGIPVMAALAQEVHRSETGTSSDKLDGYATDLKWYQSEVETANVKLDGLLGFARVWRAYVMTKNQTAQTGTYLAYAIDYAGALSGTSGLWRTTDEIASGLTDTNTKRYVFGVHLAKQQCSAVRLIFKDVQWVDTADPPATAPQTDFTLVGFALQWAQRPGANRGSAGSKQ